MTILLYAVGYFVAALVSTAIIGRLRPEWLWSKGPAGVTDWRDGMTAQEKAAWVRWSEYRTAYEEERYNLEAKVRQRMAAAEGAVWGVAGDSMLVVATLSPLVLLTLLPTSMVLRATHRSLNEKVATRAALEQDLAAARREVDALLRKDS